MQANKSKEEDFIRLDIEKEINYSSSLSKSEYSLNSSVSNKKDYYIL